MIIAASNLRTFSAELMNEWAHVAAREAMPEGAAEAEIALRAFLILAFIYGDLAMPSRSLH